MQNSHQNTVNTIVTWKKNHMTSKNSHQTRDVPIPKFLPMPNPMPILVQMPIPKKLPILADTD